MNLTQRDGTRNLLPRFFRKGGGGVEVLCGLGPRRISSLKIKVRKIIKRMRTFIRKFYLRPERANFRLAKILYATPPEKGELSCLLNNQPFHYIHE